MARDARWIGIFPASPAPVKVPGTTQPSQFALGKPIGGRKVAKIMKDGTRLCAFQQGQCKAKGPCSQGAHRCGLVVRGSGSVEHRVTVLHHASNPPRFETPLRSQGHLFLGLMMKPH